MTRTTRNCPAERSGIRFAGHVAPCDYRGDQKKREIVADNEDRDISVSGMGTAALKAGTNSCPQALKANLAHLHLEKVLNLYPMHSRGTPLPEHMPGPLRCLSHVT